MSIIEQGTVKAVARHWDLGLTKGGHDQIAVSFEILEGVDAGRSITWYGYFTDKTVTRTMESLRYCGWKGDDIGKLEGMGSLMVELNLGHKQGLDGKTYAEVRWVNQLGGGGKVKLEKPMDQGQRAMFAARMKLHAKQVPAVKGGYAAPAPRSETEPSNAREDEEGSDVPF